MSKHGGQHVHKLTNSKAHTNKALEEMGVALGQKPILCWQLPYTYYIIIDIVTTAEYNINC